MYVPVATHIQIFMFLLMVAKLINYEIEYMYSIVKKIPYETVFNKLTLARNIGTEAFLDFLPILI